VAGIVSPLPSVPVELRWLLLQLLERTTLRTVGDRLCPVTLIDGCGGINGKVSQELAADGALYRLQHNQAIGLDLPGLSHL